MPEEIEREPSMPENLDTPSGGDGSMRKAKFVRSVRLPLGGLATLYAGIIIKFFAEYKALCIDPAWHLVVWTLGPPLWFALEYWAMAGEPERRDGSLKEGQEVAGKIWAAVLVVLLYFYPDGPLQRITQINTPLADGSVASTQSAHNPAAPADQKAPLSAR